jgi:hypothetical protein
MIRVLLSFLRLPLLPSPASWLKGFVGFVRFVVQGSEVPGPRMARRTRMGSRRQPTFYRKGVLQQ